MCGRLNDMRPLPFPLRVAAGVAVTTAERVKNLPQQVTEFPVTVASQVLQTSMRVQQQVTEMAIKGDDALSFLQSTEDAPHWATFDEDFEETDQTPETPIRPKPTPDRNGQPQRFSAPEMSSTIADEHPWAQEERALSEWPDGTFDTPDRSTDIASAASDTAPSGTPESTAQNSVFPAGLTDYDQLSLPQVRAQLREMSLVELEGLLAYERDNANRPSFIGMISRRIDNVRQQTDDHHSEGPDEQ